MTATDIVPFPGPSILPALQQMSAFPANADPLQKPALLYIGSHAPGPFAILLAIGLGTWTDMGWLWVVALAVVGIIILKEAFMRKS